MAALSLSLDLPQLGLLRKSSSIAEQGMAWQGRAGGTQGGSDDSSSIDDGMAKGQTGPHPRPAGCQAWPLAGPSWLFQPAPTASAMRCVIFSSLIDAGSEQDFHQIVQPNSAACR